MTTRRMTEQEAHALFLAMREIMRDVERAMQADMRCAVRIVRHDDPHEKFDETLHPASAEPLKHFLRKRKRGLF